jgi:putative tricarboxylic transport membrane protein
MNRGHLLLAAVSVSAAMLSCGALAQGWKPERNVELIVPATAGGSLDAFGRTVQRLWDELKLVPVSSTVANRSGGAHAVAYNFLNQHPGDPYYLSITSATILTNHINGRLKLTYTDFTTLGVLLTESIAFAVRADSPIKTGKDLFEAFRKDPGSISVALGSAAGGTHHIATGLPLQSAGIDMSKIKLVSFNSSGEAVTAVLGGHVDLAVAGTVNVAAQVEAGKLRALATSSPRRMGGVYAQTPTWPELGYKGVFENWRGMIGAKGITSEQVAYWEGVLRQVVQSDEFKKIAEKNQWDSSFRGSAEMRKFLEAQFGELKGVMAFLGLTK